MKLMPAYATEIYFDEDGYLVISQSLEDSFQAVKLSPEQVTHMRGFLVGTKYVQLNRWRTTGLEDNEDGKA